MRLFPHSKALGVASASGHPSVHRPPSSLCGCVMGDKSLRVTKIRTRRTFEKRPKTNPLTQCCACVRACSSSVGAYPLVSGAATATFESPVSNGALLTADAVGNPRCARSTIAR